MKFTKKNENIASWILLLKQGVKGILKYKIQFLVIIILSFLATILLTAVMGTDKRLQDGYQSYVDEPKFTYTYQQHTGSNSLENNLTYQPFPLDYVPTYNELNQNASPLTSYNFYYDYQRADPKSRLLNPFLLISNEQIKDLFKNLDLTYIVDSNTKIYDHRFNIFQYNFYWLPAFNSMDVQSDLYQWIESVWANEKNLISTLLKNNDFKTLNSSLIGQWVQLHPKDWNKDDGFLAGYTENNAYLMLNWINSTLNSYFWHYFDLATKQIKADHPSGFATDNEGILELNKILNPTTTNTDAGYFTLGAQSTPKNTRELIYELLFGRNLYDDFGNKMIKPTFAGSYATTVGKQDQSLYLLNSDQIYQNGYRGMINPIIWNVTMPSLNGKTSDSFSDFIFGRNYWSIAQDLNYKNRKYNGSNFAFNIYFRNLMASEVSHFKFTYRNEFFFFESKSQLSYRFVLLQETNKYNHDSLNINLHIIKGRAPRNNWEVAVSPQFARKKHLRIGDKLIFENSSLTITGYATDPYSFVPSTDKDDPIPNIAGGAVVYALASAYNYIIHGQYELMRSYNNVFLTYNGDPAQLNANFNLYKAALLDNYSNLSTTVKYLQTKDPNVAKNQNLSNLSFETFDQSNYHFNWTILPNVIKWFEIISFSMVGIIMFIALIACYISVKKNIERNSSQIAILKAIGVSSNKIASTYLSYGVVVFCLVVPLGWLVGVLVEWPISELFQTFFSLKYNMILFDWRALLIALFLFGGLSILISIISALRIINQNVVALLNRATVWKVSRIINYVKTKFFINASFPTRFRLQVTSSSSHKIMLMTAIMFLASLFISLSLSLPAIINNIAGSFYKGLNYNNSYQYYSPSYNAPLSKSQVSSWSGSEALEQRYDSNAGYKIDGKMSGGYSNPLDYYDSSEQVTAFPLVLYDNNKQPEWANDYLATHNSELIKNVGTWLGNNLYSGLGNSFSVGNLDGLLNWIYHSSYTPVDQRDATLQRINSGIGKGICTILSTIMNTHEDSTNGSNDQLHKTWRQCVSDNVMSAVPPYISNYINQSESRAEQFDFGWNFNLYQPSHDIFTTSFVSQFANGKTNKTVGMNPQHPLIHAVKNASVNKLVVDQQTDSKLSMLLEAINASAENNFNFDNFQNIYDQHKNLIYDAKNHQLIVPTIMNQQASARFQVTNGALLNNNVRPVQNQMIFLDNQYKKHPLLKQFWSYDDTDYASTSGVKDNDYLQDKYKYASYVDQKTEANVINKDRYYLDPFTMPNNRFSFNNAFSYNKATGYQLNPGAYAFYDTYFKNNQLNFKLRPYYDYNNFLLFLPRDQISDVINDYKYPSTKANKSAVINYADLNQSNPNQYYFIDHVPSSAVPPSVKQGFNANNEWVEIHPYSLNYDNTYNRTGGLTNLISKFDNWINVSKFVDINSANALTDKVKTLGNLNINYRIIDTADTYDQSAFYIGSDFANLLMGYPLTHWYEPHMQPAITGTGLASTIQPFSESKVASRFDEKNSPYIWFDSKYSKSVEPTDLTTYYAGTLPNRYPNYLITNVKSNSFYTSIVQNQDLLSEKQGLIDRITIVILSIGFLFIFVIVICVVLLILMISNLFVGQYERFMCLMKTEGYTIRKIMTYTINIFTPFVFIAWLIGAAVAAGLLTGLHSLIYYKFSLAMPFSWATSWWVFIISFVIIGLMYSTAFLITFVKLRLKSTAALISEAQAEG